MKKAIKGGVTFMFGILLMWAPTLFSIEQYVHAGYFFAALVTFFFGLGAAFYGASLYMED